MKHNKGKKGFTYLVLLILLWLLLIFILSTQNGPETATTSGGLAGAIAKLIYGNPNKYQFHDVHMAIRRMAHVLLFSVLGMLLMMLCNQKNQKEKRIVISWYVISYGFLFFCSFFDEWHKQFIDGRHNDINDAILNLLGGTIGILITIWVQYRRKRKLGECKEEV